MSFSNLYKINYAGKAHKLPQINVLNHSAFYNGDKLYEAKPSDTKVTMDIVSSYSTDRLCNFLIVGDRNTLHTKT